MSFKDSLALAWSSVKSNMLRSFLTMFIIAVGITALVGIITGLDGITNALTSNLSGLGANAFTIEPLDGGQRGNTFVKSGENITYKQAIQFKERFDYPATTCIDFTCTNLSKLRKGKHTTNPNITILSIDQNYFKVKGYKLEAGRNFSSKEQEAGTNKAILGITLVKELFDNKVEDAIGSEVFVNSVPMKIIGILEPQGSGMSGVNPDRQVFITLQSGRQLFPSATADNFYRLTISVPDAENVGRAVSAATGMFRQVRRLKVGQDNDFKIIQSDTVQKTLEENTASIRSATIAIAFITILGAAIGLMNIMLVSVTERTREIGISKALGAPSAEILRQFLLEAIIITLLGGLTGIILGVALGNALPLIMGGDVSIPWNWIMLTVVICIVVGLVAGIYPATKAAQLDPIESLRYE